MFESGFLPSAKHFREQRYSLALPGLIQRIPAFSGIPRGKWPVSRDHETRCCGHLAEFSLLAIFEVPFAGAMLEWCCRPK